MTNVAPAAALLALFAPLAGACTSDRQAAEAPDATPGSSAGPRQGSVDASGSKARAQGGPLRVDGRGSLCIDNTINRMRDFTYGSDMLRTTVPVEVESVRLVNAQGISVVRSWTFPSRGIPYSGSWSGWPLSKKATSHGRLEWDERTPAEGSSLDAGRSYNFLVRMRREPGDGVQGFDAIRVEYRTGEQRFAMKTRTTVWFRKSCR